MKKKNIVCIYILVIMGFVLIHTNGCRKEDEQKLPVLITCDVYDIARTTANCGGNITSDGGSTIIQRGICWKTSSNPTINDCKTLNGSGFGIFSSYLSYLIPNTKYYVRAFATNSLGTAYGNETSFLTNPTTLSILTTTNAFTITSTSAISGGNITSDGDAAVSTRGVCWSIDQNPSITDNHTSNGSGIGEFESLITGLTENITYYLKSYAINNVGTAYGNVVSFTTISPLLPTLTTMKVSSITITTAVSGGIISRNAGSQITDRGICWSTFANPSNALATKTSDGAGTGEFTSNLNGLLANTTYYVRAYATNNFGTIYGNEIVFTTWSISDVDYNYYHIVTIGSQDWMKENLKTTKYRNGNPIPNVTDNRTWYHLKIGACCDYKNIPSNSSTYGKIYNYYAVIDSRNLCPTGWHVPTDADWTILTDYLGGKNVAGGKIKEIGTTHWDNPNIGATNESGFTALAAGYRNYNGDYWTLGSSGIWWTFGVDNEDVYDSSYDNCFTRSVYNNSNSLYNYSNFPVLGYSVRCVKDK
jgi:uncharacterized protein (TIGR02145 family)